jgi:SAM-dependent methyltransferase
MVEINSDDYHDFVFKDGKLVGEFEQMYQKSKDIPWHQDKDADKLDYKVALDIISSVAPFDEIRDVGCGLGYFLNALMNYGTNGCRLIGYDVSSTALKKAGHLFPDLQFECIDFTLPPDDFKKKISEKRERKKGKSLTAVRGFFWYVFPHMDNIVENISFIVDKGQHLLISQNFPPIDSDFIGKEVIPNPDKFMEYFTPHFMPVITNWLQEKQSKGNDNWFTALMLKK